MGRIRKFFRRRPNKYQDALAKSGRQSYITQDQRFESKFGYIEQDGNGRWKYGSMSADEIKNLAVGRIIQILVENSDVLSLAVTTYKNKIVQGFDLISPQNDKAAIKIIEDFYAHLETTGQPMLNRFADFAYSMFVEGGLCAELFFSEDGSVPIDVGLISPLSLIFPVAESPEYKKYHQVAQFDGTGRHKILQDKGNPDKAIIEPDCFVYTAINTIANKPHGSSPLMPAIFSTLALKEFLDTLTAYTKVQVFQTGVVSPDITDYINSDKYEDTESIKNYTEGKVSDMQSAFDQSKSGQVIFSDIKVEWTPLGTQTRANMDGAEIVVRILERAQGRGAKLPRVIYNPDRSGASLGEAESLTEWQIFQQSLSIYRGLLNAAFTKFHRTILRHYGNMSDVELQLDDTDYEGMLLFAETINTVMDTVTKGITQARVINQQEGRTMLLKQGSLFKDFEPELPEELKGLPEPQQPQAQPQGGNNGTESS